MSKIQLTRMDESNHIIDYIEEISRTHANNLAIIEEETNLKFTYYEIMLKVYGIEQVLKRHVIYPKAIILGILNCPILLYIHRYWFV